MKIILLFHWDYSINTRRLLYFTVSDKLTDTWRFLDASWKAGELRCAKQTVWMIY